MGLEAVIAILVGVAGVGGGWVSGRRGAVAQNAALAQDTITLLNNRLVIMESEAKKIPALMERIATLEALVTQRAEVEKVIEIVTRIEDRLNAQP